MSLPGRKKFYNWREPVIVTVAAVLLIALQFRDVDLSAIWRTPEASERAIYLVPREFFPEPGPWKRIDGRWKRYIDEPEFSFWLREAVLEQQVVGFQPHLHGVSQDSMVIVQVYDASIHDDWQPQQWQIDHWNDMWSMTGSFEHACMWEAPDELTGYFRYHRCGSLDRNLEGSRGERAGDLSGSP